MERHDAWPVALDKWLSEARDTNPYATADSLRQWDNVIRNHAADALEAVASQWRAWYTEAHRSLPTPTREHPWPDRDAMARVQDLKHLADQCSAEASRVRAQEMPSQDRVFHRLRGNDNLLDLLVACDARLAGHVDLLLALAHPGPLADEAARRPRLATALSAVLDALGERQTALAPATPF
jgi:hypothetical protein